MASGDARVAGIASSIRVLPDFPKPGAPPRFSTPSRLSPQTTPQDRRVGGSRCSIRPIGFVPAAGGGGSVARR